MKKILLSLSLLLVVTALMAQTAGNDATFSGRKTSFHANGNFNTIANFTSGIPDGEYLSYFENGLLKEKGYYKNGLKHGNWSAYNEQGQATSSAHFNLGKKDGEWLIWDNEGNLRYKIAYENGVAVGNWVMYKQDGQIENSRKLEDPDATNASK